eukprot:TRINITY_DN8328_c0_g1_i1.p1 TRINITY_DN8328_c0_g1~~TRINITY_DN8328_c0_g1_i1.p1  ORF type:complete len:332 (-),score=87.00 TRINITY_DN8328_c0_g1_i1:46-1041(-)
MTISSILFPLSLPFISYVVVSYIPTALLFKLSFENALLPQFLFDFLDSKNFKSVFETILRLKNEIRRKLSGKSELVRILDQKTAIPKWRVTNSVDSALSETLDVPNGGDFDSQEIADRIWKKQEGRTPSPSYPLYSCLDDMKKVVKLRSQLNSTKNTAYNSQDEEHERKLEQLWTLLRPNVQREGRISRMWGDIGFQGKDPATDFRAMGVLGLDQLLYFALHHPETAANTLRDSSSPKNSYPFAITGINITAFLLKLLEEKKLNHLLYRNAFNFDEIYCLVFVMFNQYYISQKPRDLMDFGPIFQRFKTRLSVFLYFRAHFDSQVLYPNAK